MPGPALSWGGVKPSPREPVAPERTPDRELSAQFAATRALAGAPTLVAAMPAILRAVCENLDWEVGAYWELERGGDALACHATFRPDGVGEELERTSLATRFSKGTGLPGRVWELGRWLWVDVTRFESTRVTAAARDGLRAAFAYPIIGPSGYLGIVEFSSREIRQPDERLLAMLGSIGSQVVQYLDRRRAEESTRFLSEASAVLATSLDYELTLQRLASLSVPFLGDWCAIDIVQQDRPYRRMATAHVDPGKASLIAEVQERWPPDPNHSSGYPKVLRTGEPELHPDIPPSRLQEAADDPDHARYLEMLGYLSMICVPLNARGRVLGAMTFVIAGGSRRFGERDFELAKDLGRRAGQAIDNAILLRQADDAVLARDEFLSVASHELRTPLTALHLLVRTLRAPDGSPAELTPEKLEIAERQVQRMSKLVNQLFDLSRVTSGQLGLELEEVDLSSIARDVAARMAAEAFEAGCVISVRTPAPVVGHWDRFRLEQIATNLVSNALKFGRGKPLEISVEDRGTEARLTVRDGGIGILPEHADRIFERFSRATPGRRYEGLGLGLYIVRQILDALRGRISVESEPGKGALFVVDLPKSSAIAPKKS